MWRLALMAALFLCGPALAQAPALRFHSPAIVRAGDTNKLGESYGCRGAGLTPPIVFDSIPPGTTSLELTMIDNGGIGAYAAEGKGFVHWHVLGLPGAIAAYPRNGALPAGVREMVNGFGKAGYGGPCPPHPPHHYTLSVTATPSGATDRIDFSY